MLNAFRHHCGQHGRQAGRSIAGMTVLNAFRHHCGQHLSVADAVAGSLSCSTPFGITADNTTGGCSSCSRSGSAQRLSASLRTTQGDAVLVPNNSLCSTPFGITADNTRSRAGPPSGCRRVLNAFRHHCGQHTAAGGTAPGMPRRAQRLSASLRTTPSPAPVPTFCRFRAQRLSASLRTTQQSSWGRCSRPRVLNAFRHHCGQHLAHRTRSALSRMCSTPFGITADNTATARGVEAVVHPCSTPFGITADNTQHHHHHHRRHRVLNAFRHHCGQHGLPQFRLGGLCHVLNAFRHHCGQHMMRCQRVSSRDHVLNAFRHHCGQHTPAALGAALRPWCSTPFGITADNTRPAAVAGPASSRAQRLSASLRTTRSAGGRAGSSVGAQRLSASLRTTRPRGPRHRGSFVSAQRLSASLRTTRVASGDRFSPVASAQRLSASLRTTRRTGRRGRRRVIVLNAFRHHCGQHRGGSNPGAGGNSCSTPFGITADNTDKVRGAVGLVGCAQRLSASLRTTPGSGRYRPRC